MVLMHTVTPYVPRKGTAFKEKKILQTRELHSVCSLVKNGWGFYGDSTIHVFKYNITWIKIMLMIEPIKKV